MCQIDTNSQKISKLYLHYSRVIKKYFNTARQKRYYFFVLTFRNDVTS